MKAAREVWFSHFADVRIDQLIWLDEFGAATNLQRRHGRAAAGERVVAAVPHGHWKLISTIAAMTTAGIVASVSFDGATDTATFEQFVEHALTPVLRAGQVVVMDNLAPHQAASVRRRIESAGARLLLLPPYSPDFNPIEMAFSKIKSVLRTTAAREVDDLFAAIRDALPHIRPEDARGYIRHSGYQLQ